MEDSYAKKRLIETVRKFKRNLDDQDEMYHLLKGTLHLLYNEDETTLGDERNKMYLKIRRFIEKVENQNAK